MKKILIVATVWIIFIGGFFLWNLSEARKAQEENLYQTARVFFEQIDLIRNWIRSHGGVYVPISEHAQPNPYLIDPRKNLHTEDGIDLTKISPSHMTRQIADLLSDQRGVNFKLASFSPINPINMATPLEREALHAFADGYGEFGRKVQIDGNPGFFYMAPLPTSADCFLCHDAKGFNQENIIGGISITMPELPDFRFASLAWVYVWTGLAGVFGIVFFGNKLNQSYQEIEKLSLLDPLTGVPNRRAFTENLNREYNICSRDDAPLSVILCDIDCFKDYNDFYGHDAGDEALKQVARVLLNNSKRPGDMCARFGGEEFVIVLPRTDHDGAFHIAEKVREHVAALNIEHKKSRVTQHVTLSLGVATAKHPATTSPREMLTCADKALYSAKEKGRNRAEVMILRHFRWIEYVG